jgi:predicted amidohydrolase
MLAARALDNTVYVVGAGECGPRNIGHSMVVDPLGVVVARLGELPGLLWSEVDPAHVADARSRLPVLANRRFDVDPRPRPMPEPRTPRKEQEEEQAHANR